MIEPFFFGPNKGFALYHPPANSAAAKLVIICPPFFDEYQRCYRALANLANACAAASEGVHVIRIEYSGTGEAQGLLQDATLDGWLEDIHSAIDEGVDLTGASQVILVGVRFGATLAAQCRHSSISNYLLWDPIDTGKQFLENIDRYDKQIRAEHIRGAKDFNRKPENIPYVNFELRRDLREEIFKISTVKLFTDIPEKIFILTSSPDDSKDTDLPERIFSGFRYDWPPFHQGNLIPKPVLEKLTHKILEI
jgi:hypothetical protein